MPLTGNVIDVQKIQLTDTFQTWFAKTNEIVDALNPVNIYDIDNGAGTNVTYGVTGTAYNGVKYVNVNAGYGVAVGGGSAKPWTGVVGLDISSISGNAYTLTGNPDYTITGGSPRTSEVDKNDYFLVHDTDDFAQGVSGTTKRVQAKYMLPREIYQPNLDFYGDLVIKGKFSAVGAASTQVGSLSINSQFVYLATTGSAGSTAGAYNTDIGLGLGGVIIAMTGGIPNKEFLWNFNTDSAKSYWTINTNYGAKSASNALVNSKFIARDFATSGNTGNTFIFEAAGSTSTRLWLTENGLNPYFGFVKDTNSSNVNFNVYNGAGITSVAYIIAGTTSQYTGVTANAFIQFANVDMVDGAHAATGASAWTIPVTDQLGQIFAERHNAGQIKRRFTQASHGLTTGQAVAVIINGAAVGTPGTITGADANSTSTEAIGIVDRVISTSEVSVTMKGYMDLSPNGLLGIGKPVTGQVYYLDWAVKGGLTTNTNVPQGKLYQPLFMTLNGSSGIVYGNEADVIFPYAQDQVYMRGMVPIGVIQPYAGSLAGLSLGLSGGSIPVSDVQYNDNWMPCDGRALSATGASGFVDLFNLIGYTYSMRGFVQSSNGDLNTVIRPDRGTANLGSLGLGSVGGIVKVIKRGAAGSDSPNIIKNYPYTGLTADGTTITFKGLTTVNAFIASGIIIDILSPKDDSYFFAPDLRGKAPFGEYAPYGARGEGFSLTAGATGGTATGDGGLFTNYLIRAKRDSDAMILTGHNHDSRYLRKDADSGAAVGTTLSLQNVEIAGSLGSNDNIGIGMSPLSKSNGFTGYALSLNRSGDYATWVSAYNYSDDLRASAGFRGNNLRTNFALYLTRPTSSTLILSADSGCSGGILINSLSPVGSLRMATSGVERMQITPTGNVGIGTTTPNGLLNVWGTNPVLNIEHIGSASTGTGAVLRFGHDNGGRNPVAEIKSFLTDSTNASRSGHLTISTSTNGTLSERMRIESGGNVGIGTTTPTYRLHLVAPAANTPSGYATDGAVQQVFAYPVVDGSVAYSGTWSNHAHALITNNAPRLWITNTGNVGIGTTDPAALLNLSASNAVLNIENTLANVSSGSVLRFGHNQDSDRRPVAEIKTILTSGANTSRAGHLTISTSISGTLTERMRIESGGKVGIGTTTPTQALDVVGSIVASGAINSNTQNVTSLSKLTRLAVLDGTSDIYTSYRIWARAAVGSGAVIGDSVDGSVYGILAFNNSNSFLGQGVLQNTGALNNTGILTNTGTVNVTGDIIATANITAYSDMRGKENISTIENGLSKTLTLSGVLYTDKSTQQRRTGLIAQDVLAVLPEAVLTTVDGQYALAYGNLVGLLVQAIKELNAKVDSLSAKVETLSSGASE